jgi:hypothetical protein
MTAAARPPRAVTEVLLSALGLAVWAAHFGAIYAANALGCERDWASWRPFGLPWVPVAIGALTLLALGALWLVFRAARRRIARGARDAAAWDEGGEAEPRFTAWFAAGAAAYSALAVLFQAAPALFVPACG